MASTPSPAASRGLNGMVATMKITRQTEYRVILVDKARAILLLKAHSLLRRQRPADRAEIRQTAHETILIEVYYNTASFFPQQQP